jgi:hypothetical protein
MPLRNIERQSGSEVRHDAKALADGAHPSGLPSHLDAWHLKSLSADIGAHGKAEEPDAERNDELHGNLQSI